MCNGKIKSASHIRSQKMPQISAKQSQSSFRPCVCTTAEKWGRKSKYVRADQEQESSGGVSCANTFTSALALARPHSHKHIK